MQSIDPSNGRLIKEYAPMSAAQVQERLERAERAFAGWKTTSFPERAWRMRGMASLLKNRKEELASLMAYEMGKVLKEGLAEIEKCAAACEHYAAHAEAMLEDEIIASGGRKSFVAYRPLGVVLAIMPWNFPFWQVFRFAAPNLMAGNVGLLKHASNVCGSALAIEQLFHDAGFPNGCFSTLLVPGSEVEGIIRHPQVRAVTLTGSTEAGRAVAAAAGAALKKTVLELGGSDAYVVLKDADIAQAAALCAKSRLINAGQSCIAAKRFIVEAPVLGAFEQHFLRCFEAVTVGHPKAGDADIGPLARADLRATLHGQVRESIAAGAVLKLGGVVPEGPGAYYPPTILSNVKPGMAAFDEELFGPVAAIIEARDEAEAFRLANATSFGLGSAVFTGDPAHGEALAKTALEAGQAFVNDFVRSDPRLPFGGVRESGYGRELGVHGIREFMNIKTVVVA